MAIIHLQGQEERAVYVYLVEWVNGTQLLYKSILGFGCLQVTPLNLCEKVLLLQNKIKCNQAYEYIGSYNIIVSLVYFYIECHPIIWNCYFSSVQHATRIFNFILLGHVCTCVN